ncbi:MAG: HlyD family efflux transporter periplasmic adaptor subunit [Mucilaginibacter polytrichastri]|nr:HlyD family efflux transporter periplasmic adaptor subunit [Mucilaginibacter polytrichastri]
MNEEKTFFPHEIVSYTVEHHFNRHNNRTKIIYQIILLALTAACVAAFFVKVNVNVRSAGVVRPVGERNELKAPVGGRIDSVMIRENQRVKAGQTLITINSSAIRQRGTALSSQSSDYTVQLADLKRLVKSARSGAVSGLKSSLYNQQYQLFRQKISEKQAQTEIYKRNFDRYQMLVDARAVSAVEYDKAKLDYVNAKNQLNLAYQEQISQWQADLNGLNAKMRSLNAETGQYTQQKDLYTIRAPMSGTVQGFSGVEPGGFVAANERIAEISPDAGLVAEMYVSPKDIGLLRVGTLTRFQVDAYNYNEWGMATGKIISISTDSYTQDEQPFFKVRCRLDQKSLQLKNGVRGNLKKGMTVQARFFIARRTLFQLLYDKTDDWLNPNAARSSGQQNASL